MAIWLYIAALLTFIVGLGHSYLGERYILIRLFRRDDLPRTMGSAEYTKRVLRFAWHITTLAFWGFGAILILLAGDTFTASAAFTVLTVTFFSFFAITLIGSGGRHLAWILFLIIAIICLIGACN